MAAAAAEFIAVPTGDRPRFLDTGVPASNVAVSAGQMCVHLNHGPLVPCNFGLVHGVRSMCQTSKRRLQKRRL